MARGVNMEAVAKKPVVVRRIAGCLANNDAEMLVDGGEKSAAMGEAATVLSRK